jgi:hypothetical protein
LPHRGSNQLWKNLMRDFISEDDLETFEGWLTYQAVDLTTATADERTFWRTAFDESRERASTTPEVGLMKLRMVPGEYRYSVAVREGADLWLTLWVRRSPKGEFFVFLPRSDKRWNPHASYHLDGNFHSKTFNDTKMGLPKKRQPLTGVFRGTENLGSYAGHAPKAVGAICDPAAFSGVVEVPAGVLGPRHGTVVVDLVEPGCEPISWPFAHVARQEVFRDFIPWVVIRVG